VENVVLEGKINLLANIFWNGRDVYGNKVFGIAEMTISALFVYDESCKATETISFKVNFLAINHIFLNIFCINR